LLHASPFLLLGTKIFVNSVPPAKAGSGDKETACPHD